MEKQRSFSIKPVRFLVISFTISFSVIFFILLSSWVIKSTPSSHLQTHNLHFNTTALTAHDFKGFSNNSSENAQEKSILMGAHFRRDEVYPQVEDVSNLGGSQEKGGEIAVVTDAEIKDSLLTGDLSLSTTTVRNFSMDGANASYISNFTDNSLSEVMDSDYTDEEEPQELNDVIDGGGDVPDDFTSGKQDMVSNWSDSLDRQHTSSRNNIEEKNKGVCDITKGRWVVDESYPLYTNMTCPFIDEGFNCEANGRKDNDYMKWRWQPQGCDILRFNATKMLELIRGKRLVFVGDSINRNQWESMLCLLMRAVNDPKKVYETRRRKITKGKGNYCFKFEDYKCTVEYYVTHFLVHESKARIGKRRVQTLRIDTIDKGSSRWRRADILVFNTAHWWSHHKTKAGINYYQERDQVYPQLDVTKAFMRALLTWASWVDKYIDPRKTRIFFRSSAPAHFSGGSWNTGGHCKEAFQPRNNTFTSHYPGTNLIVEEIISQMKNPVTFLNITRLSDCRPDGHPSIYGRKSANGIQDCSHWCLPGVPDTWNELLYYYLQSSTKDNLVN